MGLAGGATAAALYGGYKLGPMLWDNLAWYSSDEAAENAQAYLELRNYPPFSEYPIDTKDWTKEQKK